MGWKSTVELSREECIDAVVDELCKLTAPKLRLIAETRTDDELENELEVLRGGREHPYNYSITRES